MMFFFYRLYYHNNQIVCFVLLVELWQYYLIPDIIIYSYLSYFILPNLLSFLSELNKISVHKRERGIITPKLVGYLLLCFSRHTSSQVATVHLNNGKCTSINLHVFSNYHINININATSKHFF